MHDWQIIFAMPEKIFELDVTLFYCFIRHFYLPFLFEASLDSWHKDLTIKSLSTLFAFHTPCPPLSTAFPVAFPRPAGLCKSQGKEDSKKMKDGTTSFAKMQTSLFTELLKMMMIMLCSLISLICNVTKKPTNLLFGL